MRKIFFIIFILHSFLFLSKGVNPDNGLFYLKNTRLYFYDFKYFDSIRLGNTSDEILDFPVSPDNKFIAYSKKIKNDSLDNKYWQTAIVAVDLETFKIIDIVRLNADGKGFFDFWTKSNHLICNFEYFST